jgi:hypothetical protein
MSFSTAMAKRGPTVWDIGNLCVDLYQTRQIKNIHSDMEDANGATYGIQ